MVAYAPYNGVKSSANREVELAAGLKLPNAVVVNQRTNGSSLIIWNRWNYPLI
ncbi:MAG: hypothetical protein IJZ19_06505 [Lentisphaeria bacterium]|nr:hypothetical protein [Lentisphaeria bacterium]